MATNGRIDSTAAKSARVVIQTIRPDPFLLELVPAPTAAPVRLAHVALFQAARTEPSLSGKLCPAFPCLPTIFLAIVGQGSMFVRAARGAL